MLTKKLFVVIFFISCILLMADESQARFPDTVMSSVVSIGVHDSAGNWHPWGTGFLMKSYNKTLDVIVTNRHVFEPYDKQGSRIKLKEVFVKANIRESVKLVLGRRLDDWSEFHLTLLKEDTVLWTGHRNEGVDIAVMYFPPLDRLHIILSTLSEVTFIPRSFYGVYDSLNIAQDVLFLGFPLGLGANKNPRPVVRYGIIAYLDPSERSLLLDAQAFGGSSGSPVISTGTSRGDEPRLTARKLIGIVSRFEPSPLRFGFYERKITFEKKDSIAMENSGLAKVFSVDLILETIEYHHERMAKRYKEIIDSLGINLD